MAPWAIEPQRVTEAVAHFVFGAQRGDSLVDLAERRVDRRLRYAEVGAVAGEERAIAVRHDLGEQCVCLLPSSQSGRHEGGKGDARVGRVPIQRLFFGRRLGREFSRARRIGLQRFKPSPLIRDGVRGVSRFH